MENSIRNAIIKFEQEFMGRGPDEVRALVARDLVVVRLKGVLTPAELRIEFPRAIHHVTRVSLQDEAVQGYRMPSRRRCPCRCLET
ncbi:MAG: DUF2294 family protein [Nitrospira sp.]|nr:DUF2294 family protein [Nitrospira sp.]